MTREVFRLERLDTQTGRLLIATDDEGTLRALDWEDHESRMQRLLRLHYGAEGVELVAIRTTTRARRALAAYFSGELAAIDDVPVKTSGTTFQRAVWSALREIPPGRALTDGALAKHIGRPSAIRAVGHANGSNPIGIVVPCHRVIGADRSLTGYGGGIERKRWLLAHEGVRL